MFKNLYLVFLFLINSIYSQNTPITWSTSVIENENNEYTLVTKGVIKDGWRLYAQSLPEGGALPTRFLFHSLKHEIKYFQNLKKPPTPLTH